MAERTCTDCKWLEVPGMDKNYGRCGWLGPSLNAIEPKCVNHERAPINIKSPFVNCTTWEKRKFTLEEAARAAVQAFNSAGQLTKAMEVLSEVLGDLPVAKRKPNREEMKQELLAAGWWSISSYQWALVRPGFLTLEAAYAELQRTKAASADSGDQK